MSEPSFTCPVCHRTSHHPEDVKHGYCGNCHAFTGQPAHPPIRVSGGHLSAPVELARCAPDCDWLTTRQHTTECVE